MVFSRPAMQRIIINNHEWEVPNEPGWEQVVNEAGLVQERLFSSCETAAECRQIINEMYAIFNHYPVSKKFLESDKTKADDFFTSIFKWG
ncbi:unnamed protein product [Adineta steineri]|uniref:Uncharacterized protein n=1 Tax=Adineta steineri TaxID=433720 RepID=A0A815MPB8_9BILA|nr:unnamed protein product [Adineta steineri]CAF1480699.1 unnamed protein product [Adineta steineri]CAF1527346.1 unnamed protein product [Adineta steineri]CAF1652323.1 unnamed protein product [Adineta steineri]CAF3566816.1 unnamed protein product [Adineta steineri]